MFSQVNVLYPKRALASGTAVASQSVAVSTSAVGPTAFTVAGSGTAGGGMLVTFDIQAATVRCRWDGTNPTASVGHALAAGSAYTWNVDQFNNAKFIRQDSTDAVIFASLMSC